MTADRGRLLRLRKLLASRAETAYEDRDAEEGSAESKSYAAGESHAYGVAEDDARKAEREPPEPKPPGDA